MFNVQKKLSLSKWPERKISTFHCLFSIVAGDLEPLAVFWDIPFDLFLALDQCAYF